VGRQPRAEQRLDELRFLAQPFDQRVHVVGRAALEGEAVEPQPEVDARLVGRDEVGRPVNFPWLVVQVLGGPGGLVVGRAGCEGLEFGFDPFARDGGEEVVGVHQAQRLGALAGDELDQLAATADRNPPKLHARARTGEDRQWIEKHPAYRRLEEIAFSEYGLAAMSHRGGVLGWPKPMPPAVKYALSYLYVQAEFGVCCPLSMTDSLTRTLRKFGDPALVARYLPGLTGQDFDTLTQGAMFMTEQGAGSDVGATATRAVPDAAHTGPCAGGAPCAPRRR